MNALIFINLILSFVLLILNSGAFAFFIKAKAEKGHRFMKAFFVLFTGAIELALIGVFVSPIMESIGIDGDVVQLISNTNGFVVLSIMIAVEIILLLLSKDRLK